MRAAWILVFAALSSCTSRSERNALQGVRVPSLADFAWRGGEAHEVKGKPVREFSAKRDGAEVSLTRMEGVDAGEAERALKQKRFDVESLYQEEKSAYPGFLSKKVVCPKEFMPVITSGGRWLRVQAAASSRKNLGVCSRSEFKYHAIEFMLYCPRTQVLFEMRAFLTPSSKPMPEDWFANVSCE